MILRIRRRLRRRNPFYPRLSTRLASNHFLGESKHRIKNREVFKRRRAAEREANRNRNQNLLPRLQVCVANVIASADLWDGYRTAVCCTVDPNLNCRRCHLDRRVRNEQILRFNFYSLFFQLFVEFGILGGNCV
nr:uncharacterized protein [Zostera marina]